jgi:uncharacterized membrane protein
MTEPAAKKSKYLHRWLGDRKWLALVGGAGLWLALLMRQNASGNAMVVRGIVLAVVIGGLVLAALKFAGVYAASRANVDLDPMTRRQRTRNIAIAVALAGLVALFYLATLIRLGANALNRPM